MRLAPPQVRFLGAVPMSARRRLLASHHVLCVPSLHGEGAPRVVPEAYAAGRPVLASRVGGLADMVPDPWLLPAGDPTAWRAAVTSLKARVEQLTASPPAAPYSWDVVAAKVANFVTDVVKSAGGAPMSFE